MAKISNPIRFSEHFKISDSFLEELGVLDPSLNLDTPLFIDPLLLKTSRHRELKIYGNKSYKNHFTKVIDLLAVSKEKEDLPWRSAKRLMEFSEVKNTCLGYGSRSTSGSGSGELIVNKLLDNAKQIIDIGIRDPDLFLAIGLFEEGIGPDRISDMTTSIIFADLITFNHRILKSLNIPTQKITIRLNKINHEAQLPLNPFEKKGAPIILVPQDILRELPIVKSWSDVASAASENEDLRHRANLHLGDIWQQKALKDKARMKRLILSNKEAVKTAIELINQPSLLVPYDISEDPTGLVRWQITGKRFAKEYPIEIKPPPVPNLASLTQVVERIIKQFKFLIENRRLSEELYHNGSVRPEKSSQRLFFAIASTYCEDNNIDITPEADTGNGPVDFKFSTGFADRILVEIKLSTNPKLIPGYTRQLETYMAAEKSATGYYIVLDVGNFEKKMENLLKQEHSLLKSKQKAAKIIIIDGKRRPSASKL